MKNMGNCQTYLKRLVGLLNNKPQGKKKKKMYKRSVDKSKYKLLFIYKWSVDILIYHIYLYISKYK